LFRLEFIVAVGHIEHDAFRVEDPNRRLFSKGISFVFEECGKAETWRVAASMIAIAQCGAALRETTLHSRCRCL
jgi:hypothetical protein